MGTALIFCCENEGNWTKYELPRQSVYPEQKTDVCSLACEKRLIHSIEMHAKIIKLKNIIGYTYFSCFLYISYFNQLKLLYESVKWITFEENAVWDTWVSCDKLVIFLHWIPDVRKKTMILHLFASKWWHWATLVRLLILGFVGFK